MDKAKKLKVVESACKFAADHSQALICVESADPNLPLAIEALLGQQAKTLALGFAARAGIATPGVEAGGLTPYPVGEDGEPLYKPGGDGSVTVASAAVKPHRYRINIPVRARMV